MVRNHRHNLGEEKGSPGCILTEPRFGCRMEKGKRLDPERD